MNRQGNTWKHIRKSNSRTAYTTIFIRKYTQRPLLCIISLMWFDSSRAPHIGGTKCIELPSLLISKGWWGKNFLQLLVYPFFINSSNHGSITLKVVQRNCFVKFLGSKKCLGFYFYLLRKGACLRVLRCMIKSLGNKGDFE